MFGLLFKLAGVFLGYATKRSDNATATALEAIRADIANNQTKAEVIKAQLGHPIAWVPRMLIEFFAAMYFGAVVIDSIWQLPGDVSALPTATAALLGTVFAGMFIRDIARK